MKRAYPIVLSQGSEFIVVDVPDFEIGTQGKDIAEAMEMARDAIGLVGIDMEDDGELLPEPSAIMDIKVDAGSIVTLVDVDFTEYRKKNEARAVRKNCTIPAWLDYEAEKANINFSQVLQKALMEQLGVSR